MDTCRLELQRPCSSDTRASESVLRRLIWPEGTQAARPLTVPQQVNMTTGSRCKAKVMNVVSRQLPTLLTRNTVEPMLILVHILVTLSWESEQVLCCENWMYSCTRSIYLTALSMLRAALAGSRVLLGVALVPGAAAVDILLLSPNNPTTARANKLQKRMQISI